MWVRRAAIRPVPPFAEVPRWALDAVEGELSDDEDDAQERLDETFERFDRGQPALCARASRVLSSPLDETALALGYFLTLTVWMAFESMFGERLREVTETELEGVVASLELDEELRRADPAEAIDSDDVIAMEQPHVLSFIHEHIDAALDANADEVDVDDVHAIYRLVLIEVLALSYAVRPPEHDAVPTTEMTA